ncbi:CsbD family protein [Cellulomonas sp. NPDC055163]
MGLDDKIANAAEELQGKGKEAAGRASGDRDLEAEGRTDQTKADVKQAGEKIKDVFKD